MIKKIKSGYAVKHCTGKDKGKTIKKFPTKKKALSMHRAIQANKRKKK